MFLVLVNKDSVLEEIAHVGVDRQVAEQRFIEVCSERISNWDEYTPADVAAVLENGYEMFGKGVGAIVLVDTDGWTNDEAIAAMTGGFPPKDVQRVERWVECGEIGEVQTIDEILERAGACLDASQSHEICGPILFQAEDGRWYTLTVEGVIAVAHPQYVEDTLKEHEDEQS